MLAGLLAFAAQSVVAIGDFSYFEGTDPMNDVAWMGATLHSEEADLVIGCDHNRAKTVFVSFKAKRSLAYPASSLLEDLMPFEYRVDQQSALSEFSTYGSDVATLEGARARALAERLANGSRIVIRVDGLSGPIIAEFSARGANEAINRIARQCGDTRLLKRLTRR